MLFGHGMKRLKKLSTHSRKSFQSSPFWGDLISARSSFYTVTKVVLVLVLFLANMMMKAKIMLSPMHLETTSRLSKYFSYEGDCLIDVWAIIHFRPYLYGTNFTLYTNHQPIKWLMTNDKLTNKWAHWALILQEYEFKVIHRPGITH
jgi:hypothetical protein